jgi:hypothetical protein
MYSAKEGGFIFSLLILYSIINCVFSIGTGVLARK